MLAMDPLWHSPLQEHGSAEPSSLRYFPFSGHFNPSLMNSMVHSSVVSLWNRQCTASVKRCQFAPVTNKGWRSSLRTASLTLLLGMAGPASLAAGNQATLNGSSATPPFFAIESQGPQRKLGTGHAAERSTRHPAHRSIALSQDVREVLIWVQQSGNNAQLPFVLVDKRSAAIHLFDANGVLQASSAALMGLAQGDHSVPGIGERPLSQIAPHERTTPAGRFVSEPGRNLKGEDIVWIDYGDAVSLHRVRQSSNPAERRLQRLASRTSADNRISYGCVNLPVSFYDRFVMPTLGQQAGVIYVLPEMQPVAEFFGFKPSHAPR